MKRIVIVLLSVLIFGANQVFAFGYNIKHFSDDYRILAALEVLKNAGAEEVFDNLAEKGVTIKFCDLTMIDYQYYRDYAISSADQFGNRVILINTAYKNSSKEALACLIAHESFHKANVATFAEEVKCTQKEAEYWHKLKNDAASSVNNDLTKRLNTLEQLYLTSNPGNDKIAESIRNNEFYRNQLALK